MKPIILLFLSSLLFSEDINESNLVKVKVEKQAEIYPSDQESYIAFNFQIKPDWHIYWSNPGDSGLDTKIELVSKSDGIEFGEILWPTPDKIPFDGMANFGFENSVTLLIPIKFSRAGDFAIKANISWLVCKEICLPQDTSFNFKISSKKNYESNASENATFKNYLNSIPDSKNITVNVYKKDEEVEIELEQFKIPNTFNLEYYPYDPGIFSNGEIQKLQLFKNKVKLTVPLDNYRIEEPTRVNGLIVIKENGKLFESFEIKQKID